MSSKAFEPQASVHALSDSTTASMRAHMQFPSPSAVVQALLYNALDAGAKKISLTADLVAGSIECSDDGLGFPPAFFSQGSDRGAQSSMPWAQGPVRIRTGRYGRKQESLQLMAYLGRVSIRSTPDNCSNECFLRIQRGDRCIFSGKDREAPPPLNGFRSGSSVCVSDLFANLPVRRRAADTAWSRRAETNKIHAVVKTVSLREPHVSFALRMQSQGSLEGSRRSVQEALRLQKTTSILSRFVDAHGRSTINPADLLDFQYTTSDPDGLVLQGLFSAVPSPSRDIQYVYVNKHPLAQNTSLLEHLSGASIMFSTDEAQDQNPTFTKAASHHGIVDLDSDLYGIMAMVLQHAMQASPTTMYQALARPKGADLDSPRGSPTKASTCFPIFYLDVTIGPAALNRRTSIPNIQISPPLSLKAILQEQIVRALRLRTAKTRIGSPFWETMTVPTHQKDDRGSPFEFSVLNHSPHAKASPCPEPLSSKSGTQDVDPGPSSKTAGDVTNHLLFDSNSTARSRAFTSPTKRLHRLSRPEHGDVKTQTTTPEWLNAATSTWRNPTLPLPSEPDIPCVGLRSGSLKEASQTAIRRQYLEDQADPRTAVLSNAPVLGSSAGKLKGDLSQKAKQTYPRSSLMDFQQPEEAHASISKDDIRLSRVIGQVDRKFILCTTNVSTKSDRDSGAAPTLLLVDQHAADERVRVEALSADYVRKCREGRPDSHRLPKAVRCEVTSEEAESLQGDGISRLVLCRAGFDVKLEQVPASDAEETSHILAILAVPSIVKNRLASDPSLLVGLVKAFMAAGMTPQGPVLLSHLQRSDEDALEESDPQLAWLKILRTYPRLMLDLINSRACRGAIMFNDVLGQEQCESLVQKLSETVFPFQCAHGRPSMLPLAHLSHSVVPPAAPTISWYRLND